MTFWLSLFPATANAINRVSGSLEQSFATPPDSTSLWCYYYWISDNISKEGITKDLEAMKRFGIGAALIGNIGQKKVPSGNVKILTEPWWQATEHAIREGKRIGVDIGLFNCPGWSQSGGPWVKPSQSMRYLSTAQDTVEGPGLVRCKLKTPATPFQDVAVIAFPLDTTNASSLAGFHFPRKGPSSYYAIDLNLEKPYRIQGISLTAGGNEFSADCELSVKDSLGNLVLIRKFVFDRSNASLGAGFMPYGPLLLSFPATTGTQFHLIVSNINATEEKTSGFSEIELLTQTRLDSYIEKQLGKMCQTPLPLWDQYLWPVQPEDGNKAGYISKEQVLNLSRFFKDSVLTWKAPSGKWIVQRIGMTPTGIMNDPSAPNATGLEVDKMNKGMVAGHFNAYIGEILRRMSSGERSAFKYTVADSYEKGSQNWTDGLEKEFLAHYGYDPVLFFPVLSGRIVQSVECSNRFLWDLRRLVADRVASDYVGGLRAECEKNNLKLWLENYGHWGFPGEFLQYGGQSNLVSGEFWNEGTLGNIECKAASSSAHIYGKTRISAEAFTASGQAFQRHPALLKKRGDWAFTEGINHFVLHLYIHQPDERVPGVNAWFSTEFNRHNTWFERGKVYADYLRRCMVLLQQGKPVTDVAYFIGEDAPKMTGVRNPELPPGYSYDYINAEALMQRVTIKDGRMVFPDGFTCKILVLPNLKTMRPETLIRIRDLVLQGMIVFGKSPIQSPSLKNYPKCDSVVRQTASELWKEGDSIHRVGKGKVYSGTDLQSALLDAAILPDLVLPEKIPVLWTHRTLPGMEIYFLTNQGDQVLRFSPAFKVSGLQPEFWDAVNGEVRPLKQFTPINGSTVVPLVLYPAQSGFVVFRKTGCAPDVNANNFPERSLLATITSPWTVSFDSSGHGPDKPVRFNTLTDWSTCPDERIRYYSGSAVYANRFVLATQDTGRRFLLDLGKVQVIATVRINGKEAGGTWIAPQRIDITEYIRSGENTIEVNVVNTWHNRLVGDAKLPEAERKTWIPVNPFKPTDSLLSSGLLGPVTLMTVAE